MPSKRRIKRREACMLSTRRPPQIPPTAQTQIQTQIWTLALPVPFCAFGRIPMSGGAAVVPKPKPNAFAFPRQQRQRSIAKILSPTPREQRQIFIAKLSPTSYRFFAGLLLFSFRLSSFSFHASGFRSCSTSGRTSATSSGLLSSTSCLSWPSFFRPWPLKSQTYFSNSSKHTAMLFNYPASTALSTVSPSRQQPQLRWLTYLAPRIAM
jgi:hypothetical protein